MTTEYVIKMHSTWFVERINIQRRYPCNPIKAVAKENVSHALESLKLMMIVSHAMALLLNFPKAVKANGSNKWNAVNPGKQPA